VGAGWPNESPGARPPDFGDRIRRMIRIAITLAAYAAIAAKLALGTVAVEPERVTAPVALHTDN
jgi:hypothetical protein